MAGLKSVFQEEQALFEQEQGVVEMEVQFHAQEEGLVQMERSFSKRSQTLGSLVSYVSEQQQNLIQRASLIGSKAKSMCEEALSGLASLDSVSVDDVIGLAGERTKTLERRQRVLEARMNLIEEREALYAKRLEAIETAESRFNELEEALLAREKVVANTLRMLITAASELGDDDEEEEDDEEPDPAAPLVSRTDREGIAGGKPMTVLGGDLQRAAEARQRASGHSASEHAATHQRRGRTSPGANLFKITLEAVLGGDERHEFFRYRADGPDDLPGLFLATPNLLKEGREVRLRMKLGDLFLEASGVVSWRRQAEDANGPPGMGIEITSIGQQELNHIHEWLKANPPMVV